VRLAVGQQDLIPRRIAYHRSKYADSADHRFVAPQNPFLVLEFYEVSHPSQLDDSLFLYQPGNQEVIDHTDIYLQRLKPAADGPPEDAP
jgi:hypothetical protein